MGEQSRSELIEAYITVCTAAERACVGHQRCTGAPEDDTAMPVGLGE